jgi:hypothetical protein
MSSIWIDSEEIIYATASRIWEGSEQVGSFNIQFWEGVSFAGQTWLSTWNEFIRQWEKNKNVSK